MVKQSELNTVKYHYLATEVTTALTMLLYAVAA